MSEKQAYLRAVLAKTKDIVGVPIYGAFGDGEWFFTAKPISWVAGESYAGKYGDANVPTGFVTDLASIPSPFWSLMPRDGVYLSAAIVHDYIYWVQDRSRKDADDIFNIGMMELRVPGWKRWTIHTAVSLGGGRAWNSNARMRESGERRVLKRFPDRADVHWSHWKQQDVFAM